MEDNLDFSTSNLEHCSYRYLQQLAKSMNLPSNVKKVHLIEMINAKKCSPESEVTRIVRRIKLQRQQLTQVKKRSRRVIQVDTSSGSESASPPITITPKRPVVIRCNPEVKQVFMRSNVLQPKPSSDRVLRSYHVMKPVKRYINQMLESSQSVDQGTQMNMRVVRKYKPNILSGSHMCKEDRQVPVSQMAPQMLIKRPRLLSGIYPINKETMQVQSVGVRNREGKMSKINAFIHKPHEDSQTGLNSKVSSVPGRNIELTIQDIIDGNLDAQAHVMRLDAQAQQSLKYPNTSGVNTQATGYPELCDSNSVYYHKKIRADQVRERRLSAVTTRCQLPRIGDAFGQFRTRRDVTQPLSVQVGEEAERILNYPLFAKRNTCLLETMYNFKTPFLTNQPLLQIATTSNTKCVYSTPTMITAVAQRAPVTCTETYMGPFERDSQYQYNADPRVNEWSYTEQDYDFRYNTEQNTSSCSAGTAHSQELGANVTISDMVEDALELISQDGDYMERMGMDVRMQCVLCQWAGPKIILEYHIRKEHSSEIEKQDKAEWCMRYRLGALVRGRLWSSRVVEHQAALYVLSVKHQQPDRLLATLSALSPYAELTTASLSARGASCAWRGAVRALPASLPYDAAPGLALSLADLNLLPDSPNLRFGNGDLGLQSPSKVIFGHDLNDIQIVLYVKIFDYE